MNDLTRRNILQRASCGFGYLAFAGLATQWAQRGAIAAGPTASSGAAVMTPSATAPRAPHHAARAKRVIFLCMRGGPSHVDTFDHKPALTTDAGKKISGRTLMPSPWGFKRYGESGLPISDVFPNLAQHADDLCLINGMHGDVPAHPEAFVQLHTGSFQFVRPSVGAWTLYGLGTDNENLPGFITINPPSRVGGSQNYGSAFLPAAFQGTRIGSLGGDLKNAAIDNIRQSRLSESAQRRQIDLVQAMNRDLASQSHEAQDVEGVIESYELAFRMQAAVPSVMDLTRESTQTLEMYGVGGGDTDGFGRQCLLARRFAEAGVRYIELSHSSWDQHNGLEKTLGKNARQTDQPIAALLTDLKQRGMLEDTLVVWGGEFGRTPHVKKQDGRDHNHTGFTFWMAGGGVRGGIRHGATDPNGITAVENTMDFHDLHATILHLMGLNHERLTYRYAGRDFRLTDVYGHVAHDIVA
ncbi:MAG: DUF1501 domain-containing protein [Phycisphaera sp.]|nr:DUF1501 domain-containing protein [Phycisphaera sp.]